MTVHPAKYGDPPSPRETQVAIALLFGRTREQTAKDLFVEPCTVDAHRYKLYIKFGARSCSDLAAILLSSASLPLIATLKEKAAR